MFFLFPFFFGGGEGTHTFLMKRGGHHVLHELPVNSYQPLLLHKNKLFLIIFCPIQLQELTTEGLGYHSFQLFGFDFMVDHSFMSGYWKLMEHQPVQSKLTG